MNKRILDGAGLWKSDKIARIQPEWMRAEYANWIPLALANGVFEADTRRVWATVYSYNRPSVALEDAEQIRREFCRVGLLFLWSEEGKIWGYFTGIEKPGRLPAKSRLAKKHEETGPIPPAEVLRSYTELTRAKPLDSAMVNQWLANGCLGSGSGSGSGENHSRSKAALVREALPIAEGFEERFWVIYPRKKGKIEAQRAWRRVKPEEVAAIVARVELNNLGEWKGKDPRYIPHPATWLNGRRWEDEIEQPRRPGPDPEELRRKRTEITPEGKAALEKAGYVQ